MILGFGLNAQNTGAISGTVTDQQSKAPLSGATVRLTSTTDSSFARSMLSDSLGNFRFSALPPDSFRLSISFVGFGVVTRGIRVDSTEVTVQTGLVPNASSELATVIITSTPSPVTQRGDTLQINASQFKVNPDASGEDLIRKVPGVTIENGQVKAQGENVQKVTIDGRELFGDDATAALRNLPAEIVDKIQIFDRLSDQAQFTGFDDGNTSKSINIVTKANMRNGQFGRIFAGYGTDERYQAGGNATILKDNRRISLVGNFNNVNQQNFSQQDLLGVTSNAQRGGGGGGPRGGGGGPRGGSGNRGPSGGGGNQGGGNFGGFGNSGNFLVGQQNGINKTNAVGINFSDVWGPKLTVTGSYLFNNTNNVTSEIANTQYLAGNFDRSADTTLSDGNNFNHRVNMRLEWKIDSSNQLIITPNLSFQDNTTDRTVGRSFFFTPGNPLQQSFNRNLTNSTRSGNNLNNTILYRHSFPKRGRTFSVNLNTSYNKRDGETYVTTFQRAYASTTNWEDSSSQRFTDQYSDGLQLSTNLIYTEPVGQNAQLQFNYNPSISKSTSDQQTYAYDDVADKYSEFLQPLSNKFENRTTAHNGGVSYRYGTRDRQFSVGANVQSTNLKSEQVFPNVLSVNKTFTNLLPNAMFRYGLTPNSNIRIMYRSNVNQPSVTQLQNVVDIVNAPIYTAGNPDLNQQFMHTLSARYTFTNTAKGLLFVGNVFWQMADNYIANATFTPRQDSAIGNNIVLTPGEQLNKPVNLDGYSSLRSFLTFAVPLKFIKSNFNLNGGVTFSRLPGIANSQRIETKNLVYSLGTVIASNVSQYVDFTVSYTANFNNTKSSLQETNNNFNYFQHTAGVQLNLLSKSGWFLQNDFNNQYYNGLSENIDQSFFLWNVNIGKKFLKDQKGELRLGVFDLLGQNQSISRNVTETYIEDVQNVVLQRYFMLTFTYNLRNFGTAAARAANRAARGQ